MSLKKKKSSFLRSFAFRLTFRYAILFFIFSVVVFSVTYSSLIFGLRRSMDKVLLTEIKEIEADFYKEGMEQVKQDIYEEIDAVGSNTMFFRLMTNELEIIASSEMSYWGRLDVPVLNSWAKMSLDGPMIYRTVDLQDRNLKARIITHNFIDGKYIIQIGQTMRDTQEIALHYSKIFGVAIFLLFICGIGLAWMVANRAMKGVRRVTQTAKNIRHEGFHHRVQEGMEGTEIQELAVTFNNMLNRIESLIMELKDVTNNLAHDLRTPLTRIRGQAETALRVDQPNMKSYEEVIGTVVEECDRLVQMINTTLEIAQIESGIDNVDHCAVDLVDIVQKGCNVFLPLAQDKEIQLKIHCPQEPVCVLGSVPRLQRVMSNLLDNAIKFTGEGGQVDVTLKAHGTNAVLSVKDTGIGIPSNQQEHIFEKFYRAESSRSTPGSGLGLSYVKSMISSLAGNISVSSTPGQGSTFIAEIPLVKPQ